MTDYKHLNQHRRAADHPLEGALTGVGFFIVVVLALFYLLALAPAGVAS